MKESEKIIEDKIENVKQVQIEKETQLIGSVKNLKKGLTLFEINRETLEVNPAEFEKTLVVDFNAIGNQTPTKKVVTKEGCFYSLALNKKNALKKYQNYLINGPKK